MSLIKVHHAQITIPKNAEEAAREFYSRFLGLTEILKPESLRGRGGFWLELGDLQIHVGTENDFDRSQTKAHLAYQVKDLNGWREKFAALGIEVIDGIPIPGCNRFEFRNPFGNRVEFLESV